MRQRGRCSDNFSATDDQTAIGLLLDMHVDIAHLGQFLVAVYRRIDDRMIDEADFFLGLFVPMAGIFLKRLIKTGVRSQSRKKRGLVIRATAHPSVRHARPFRNGIASGHHFLRVA